jgi:AraC family transcriptional regulator, transcriptional activator of pobA
MLNFETIQQYSSYFDQSTLHPLIDWIDLSQSTPKQREAIRLGFYAIFLKETRCGDIRYGNQSYDYAEGTMIFIAPHQVIRFEPEGEWHQPYGKALVFHPDLIKGSHLSKQMPEYTFFQYQSHEALHLSERERLQIQSCFDQIIQELHQNIDKFSKKLVLNSLELLLNYIHRFYDRQFLTRSHVQTSGLVRFEQLLTDYFVESKTQTMGLPTVTYFAEQMHLSPNYLGDLIKRETGLSPLEFIQLKLIELAKDQILDPAKTISEVAYALGFRYPQHFSRLFKAKVGVTPKEYRIN